MAPIRKINNRSKASPMRKVQTGRIGQSSLAKNSTFTRNAGKELFPQHPQKQPFSRLNSTAPAQISAQKLAQSKISNRRVKCTAGPKKFARPLSTQRQAQESKHLSSNTVNQKSTYLKELNAKLRLLKASKDGTAKRLTALHNEITYRPPQDVRDKNTVPYAQASLHGTLPSNGTSTLNIYISCGFWGYEAACTPSKVYGFRLDGFADPEKLRRLLFHSQDVIRSMKQMGVHLSDKTIEVVGYEVLFPKGLRHRVAEFSDIKRHEPIEYTAKSAKVLVNTACALREFWLQARDYASDERGNIIIPVVARLGIREVDNVWGGEKLSQFTAEWRSKLEKKWLVEEERIELERQQFATEDQQKRLQDRMKAIEAAADKAMQRTQKTKDMPDMRSMNKPGGSDDSNDEEEIELDLELEDEEEEIAVENKLDGDVNMTIDDALYEDLFLNM